DPIPVASPWTLVRCHELAKTNEPPNAAELDFMRPFLSKIAARLTRFDNEITQLKDRLQRLETERGKLAEYHTQHAGIVSPLRRVPPEILAEIFSWTLPTIDEVEGDVSDLQQSPWVLTQVSSLWRRTAISIPWLWSSITWSDWAMSPPLPMIQAQVDRARNLRISFYAYESGSAAAQVEMFEFLSEHCARWVDLKLRITAALGPHLAALRGRLPSLQRLWLRWDTEQSEATVDSIECFETASSLVDIGLQNESRFIPILVPAHQLTSYRIHGPWEFHHRVIKLCPNLVEANLALEFDDEQQWPDPQDTIDLPRLRRLFVNHTPILGFLCTPALSEIGLVLEEGADPCQDLDGFVVRSSCALHRLTLVGLLDVAVTAAVLKKHSSIRSVVLIFDNVDFATKPFDADTLSAAVGAHLNMFTYRDPPTSPNLNEIRFGSVEDQPFPIDYPLFLKMLQSRRRSPFTLNAAAFLTKSGPDPDSVTMAELDALRQGGLRLLVKSGSHAELCVGSWSYDSPLNTGM
ncbi:hypothetical protein FB45DRAFT_926270, partial [Roridomyces roridus]